MVADERRLYRRALLAKGVGVGGASSPVVPATVTVTETGYVEEVTYDLTVDRGYETVGRAATGTVLSVGETIPEQATVSVSPAKDDRSGTAQFDQPLSVGDTLYAGFDEEGRLAADVNELPLTSMRLGERASVVVELGRFPLFKGTLTV